MPSRRIISPCSTTGSDEPAGQRCTQPGRYPGGDHDRSAKAAPSGASEAKAGAATGSFNVLDVQLTTMGIPLILIRVGARASKRRAPNGSESVLRRTCSEAVWRPVTQGRHFQKRTATFTGSLAALIDCAKKCAAAGAAGRRE